MRAFETRKKNNPEEFLSMKVLCQQKIIESLIGTKIFVLFRLPISLFCFDISKDRGKREKSDSNGKVLIVLDTQSLVQMKPR